MLTGKAMRAKKSTGSAPPAAAAAAEAEAAGEAEAEGSKSAAAVAEAEAFAHEGVAEADTDHEADADAEAEADGVADALRKSAMAAGDRTVAAPQGSPEPRIIGRRTLWHLGQRVGGRNELGCHRERTEYTHLVSWQRSCVT
jgi:hypothetical protein